MSAHNSSKSPSTFDLLRWPDSPQSTPARTPARSSQQPVGGISSIMLGAGLTPEEAEALQKRKPNSESKAREMSGSGIFSQDDDLDHNSAASDRPMVRVHQPAAAVSQISFGVDGVLSPKKPTSVSEVAKQRELTGTLESDGETPVRKPTSTSKVKELVGSDIFGPPPELPPRSLDRSFDGGYQENAGASTASVDPSTKVNKQLPGGPSLVTFGEENQDLSAKKSNQQKVAELSGTNIFKDNASPAVPEKSLSLSAAKRREMSGSDIFADGKPVMREHLGGIRKPPGGESSLTLV